MAEDRSKRRKSLPAEQEDDSKAPVQASDVIVIPSTAAWFRTDSIHEIEKNSLPEWFTDTTTNKTPEMYMQYRNEMIHAWRLSPRQYYSRTAARRSCTGDAGAVIRIHDFLEHWGLINYNLDTDVKPLPVHVSLHSTARNNAPAAITGPVPPLIDTIQLHNDKFASVVGTKLQCCVCSGSCGNVHYARIDNTNDIICQECYNSKRYPAQYTPASFTKIESPVVPAPASIWTEQEILALYEGIEMFGEKWADVAAHVGKSEQECILQFLRAPIEDPYLQNAPIEEQVLKNVAAKSESEHDDQLMIASLMRVAKQLPPHVVNAAVKTVITELSRQHTEKMVVEGQKDELESMKDHPQFADVLGAVAVAAAACKAKVLADAEMTEIRKILDNVIITNTEKLERKMSYLSGIEEALTLDRQKLDKERRELMSERTKFMMEKKTWEEKNKQQTPGTPAAPGTPVQ